MTRLFYAAQSPRGFSNEINVYSFSSLAYRNAWVEAHENDGDVNSTYRGAYKVDRKTALRIGGRAIDGAGFLSRGHVNARKLR